MKLAVDLQVVDFDVWLENAVVLPGSSAIG
jgi:hypothetical protein